MKNREEAHIASIWATSDPSKMGGYDGRKTVQVILRRVLSDESFVSAPNSLTLQRRASMTARFSMLGMRADLIGRSIDV